MLWWALLVCAATVTLWWLFFALTERARLRVELAEAKASLEAVTAERDKFNGHKAALRKALEKARSESGEILDIKKKEIAALTAERDSLKAENEKLANDYNKLSAQVPGYRPKAVKWSGPGGARAMAEAAAAQRPSTIEIFSGGK